MRIGSKRQSDNSAHSTPTGAKINNANWGIVFGEAIRARGGMGFVIRNQEPKVAGSATPAEWHAWMVYFEDHAISTRFMREYGIATVPVQWPEDFEAGREDSDRYWQFPATRTYDPNMRERVGTLFAELAKSIDPGIDRQSRRRGPQTKQEAETALSAGFPHLKGAVTLSPAARKSFGLD